MATTDELNIITRMRGEVICRKELTGENLFLAWGYPTAIVLLLEFAALLIWNEDWCVWLWMGIPLIGIPLMMYFMNEDYERTRHRTLVLLRFSRTALWLGMLHDRHYPPLPSEDGLWHYFLCPICLASFFSG